MPPKKGSAGGAKPAKGAKGEESGDKGKHFKTVLYNFVDFTFITCRGKRKERWYSSKSKTHPLWKTG